MLLKKSVNGSDVSQPFTRKVLPALTLVATLVPSLAFAGMEEAKKWVDSEFIESSISKAEQLKEMEFFVNAAKPFTNLEIKVVSETIATHVYESETLAKAFTEITGIKVNHVLTGEGDVI